MVSSPHLLSWESLHELYHPVQGQFLRGQLHLTENCSSTMQTWGQQSLLLGGNGQHYTEGLRPLTNTCLELRWHVFSCTSCKQRASRAESWQAEAVRPAEHFHQPKHPSMINTRNVFVSSYLEKRTRRFWHAAWNHLAGRMSREDRDRREGWGPSRLCSMWILVRAVHANQQLSVMDLGNPWHSHCLISRTSTTVNVQHTLVWGLFERPSPQAMAGSLSMHGSCHVR